MLHEILEYYVTLLLLSRLYNGSTLFFSFHSPPTHKKRTYVDMSDCGYNIMHLNKNQIIKLQILLQEAGNFHLLFQCQGQVFAPPSQDSPKKVELEIYQSEPRIFLVHFHNFTGCRVLKYRSIAIMSLLYTPSIPESASLMQRPIKAALRASAGSLNKSTLHCSRLIMGKNLTGLWLCLPALICLLRLPFPWGGH